MFGWYSIGLAMAFGAFCGVYVGFGLAFLMCHAPVEPPQHAECGYDVDNSEVQDFTAFDDARAKHLLKQCDL